jgi:hypothetical protein
MYTSSPFFGDSESPKPEAKLVLNELPIDHQNTPTQFQGIEQSYVVIELFHKQRGGKGVWNEIEHGNFIRVTKNVGKKVKLVVRSSVKFDKSQINVKLVDLIHPDGTEKEGSYQVETFAVKENEIGGTNAEYELKIFILSKKLEFRIEIKSGYGHFRAESICFGTHNSGKQRKKKEPLDQKPKKILIPYNNPDVKRKRVENGSPDNRVNKKFFDESSRLPNKPQFTMNDYIQVIQILHVHHNQYFEFLPENITSTPIDMCLNEIGQDTQVFYPETVGTEINHKIMTHADMLPCAITRLSSFPSLLQYIDMLVSINIGNLRFSHERIQQDTYKIIQNLYSKTNFVSKEFLKDDIFISKEFIRTDFNTYENIDISSKIDEYGDSVIIPEGIKNSTLMSIAIFRSRQVIDEFFFVLYKANKLYSDRSKPIQECCKYILIVPENNNYNGHYSVVKFFNGKPLKEPMEADTLVIYDFRDGKKSHYNMTCKPMGLDSSLWILGSFTVTDEGIKWDSPLANRQTPIISNNNFDPLLLNEHKIFEANTLDKDAFLK